MVFMPCDFKISSFLQKIFRIFLKTFLKTKTQKSKVIKLFKKMYSMPFDFKFQSFLHKKFRKFFLQRDKLAKTF